MIKGIPYNLLVFPKLLDPFFKELLDEGTEYCGDIYHQGTDKHLVYYETYCTEEDFIALGDLLYEERIPFNYYPSSLDEPVVMLRLNKDLDQIDSNLFCTYALFLEQKFCDTEAITKYIKTMVDLENNWDNQVKIALEHRLIKYLEE